MNYLHNVNRANIEDILMLSPMQEGILFHYLSDVRLGQYFEQLSLRLQGEVRLDMLEAAWNVVIATNEVLRTVYRWKKLTKPIQLVLKKQQLTLAFYDLSAIGTIEQLSKLKQADRQAGFDLENGPLFRVMVCYMGGEEFEMVISYHHILFDGWSTGVILKEFFSVYQNLLNGEKWTKPTKRSYKEYLKWLKNRDLQRELDYWREYLQGFESKTLLPYDQVKQKELKTVNTYHLQFPDKISIRITEFAKKLGVTLSVIINAIWGLLLLRYNNNTDIVFGATVSGRPATIAGIEEMVGLFINTLPVRIRRNAAVTVVEFLAELSNAQAARDEYLSTPLVEIKAVSEIEGGSTLFDSIVVIENYPLHQTIYHSSESLQILSYDSFAMTNFDLTLVLTVWEKLECKFMYNVDLFQPETIARLGGMMTRLTEEIIDHPEKHVSKLDLLTPEERCQLLSVFNTTMTPYPTAKTIWELFHEKALQRPDEPALIMEDTILTYQELARKAENLAILLLKKGVKAETIVGMLVEPSIIMIIGIFGVLRANGAYLPMDPHNPADRIRYMLTDSGAKILLTQLKFKPEVQKEYQDVEVLYLEELILLSDLDASYLNIGEVCDLSAASTTNLAYVIYTSGSTGEPKGVMVEQRSLINLLMDMQRNYPLEAGGTWLLKTPYTFDVSLTEIFGWFLGCGKLVVLESGGEKDPRRIIEVIRKYNITHLNFVPSMYNVFIDYLEIEQKEAEEILGFLKYLFVAGEPISKEQVKRFYMLTHTVQFINLYGPTESTVYVTGFPLKDAHKYRSVPIGKGLTNVQLYILDQDENLQPIGFPGELYIAGDCLARGYLGRPELTSERFRANPFGQGKIYKSGDLVRYFPDGQIEYLGRQDFQVKIRGYRIEIGEIENRLLSHPQVKEAAVLAITETSGLKYLCAYLTLQGEVTVETLKKHLLSSLPDYMVPSQFVVMGKMPLSPNGKLNRKELPHPKGPGSLPQRYTAPRTVIEAKLAKIWEQILGVTRVGIYDKFIDLGGHSLKAVQLAAQVLKEFNVEIPIKDIFTAETISELARLINEGKGSYEEIQSLPKQKYYPTSSAQKRLYLLNQLDPANTSYNLPAFFEIAGVIDLPRFQATLQTLIQRHESLRTAFRFIHGELVQEIAAEVEFKLSLGEITCENELTGLIRPFNIECAPLFRVELLKMAEDKYFLMLDMHHLIADGVSLEILIKEMIKVYAGEELPDLKLQYRDFVAWQTALFHERNQSQEKYWLKEFSREILPLQLPIDFPRPFMQKYAGNSMVLTLEEELTEKLNILAKNSGVTLFVLLLSIYYIFLEKYSGQEDIVIGTPVAGRTHPDLQGIIGMFVNTLAIRMSVNRAKPFNTFLTEVQEKVWAAFENQDYQFEMLVERLDLEREMGRNPLFDTMFVLQDLRQRENLEFPDFKLYWRNFFNPIAKFDLTIYVEETTVGLNFKFEYATALFAQETIEGMGRHLLQGIEEIVRNPQAKIVELQFIPTAEKEVIYHKLLNLSLVEPPLLPVVQYVTPRNEIEAKLTEIYAEVFGCQVGINDNFFHLGGHSLKGVQVITRIAKELKIELPLKELFTAPVIKDLALIIARLNQGFSSVITKQPELDYYPLSSAQRRIFFLQEIAQDTIGYNIPLAVRIQGELDQTKFTQAFFAIIERHESLRTCFELIEGQPMQRIKPEVGFKIHYCDLSTGKKLSTEMLLTYLQQFTKPFDLKKPPLFRVELCKLKEQEYLLFLDMHHIITDGFSMRIFLEDFTALYNDGKLSPLEIQYRDFSIWQNSFFQCQQLKIQEEFWLKEFSGEIPVLNLPTDFSRPLIQDFTGSSVDIPIGSDLVQSLQKLSEAQGATLYITLLAIYYIFLAKYTGQEEFTIGMPVAGRNHVEVEKLIGMFVNSLAIRNTPTGEKTFLMFLAEVREKVLQVLHNQDYPLEELVEKLHIKRDLSRNPLFDTMFALQNMLPVGKYLDVNGLIFENYRLPSFMAKFDLTLTVTEISEGYICSFEYPAKLFRAGTIQKMADHFLNLIAEVSKNPEQRIKELRLLSEEEIRQLLYTWNDTLTSYPQDKTIAELFEIQTVKTPEKTAVSFGDTRLSYRELNLAGNQVAQVLHKYGVKSDQIVAIMVERSFAMVCGIVGILKAGGAYLPIDGDLPDERKQFMLQDAGVEIILTQNHLNTDFIDTTKVTVIHFAEDNQTLLNPTVSNCFALIAEDEHLTYSKATPLSLGHIIYTSGSTGEPKGVMTEQRGIIRLFYGINYMLLGEETKVLQMSTYAFDASVVEMWGALLFGGELVLIDKETLLRTEKLAKIIQKKKITFCLFSPVIFNKLIDETPEALQGIKHILVGGDTLSAPHIRKALKLLPETVLINGYGPTENSTLSTYYLINDLPDERKSIPIGRPISNSKVYILDQYLRLVPPGVVGELCLAGVGLARGYLNRPVLSSEKFIANPYFPGEIIYRSGDLGRYLPDGNIDFVGRADNQVKIRGLRIELGEIEMGFANIPGVKECCVAVKEDLERCKYLVGYYISEKKLGVSEIRDHLAQTLPEYMVPAYFIRLDHFPLTTSGKIDRRVLPSPDDILHTGTEYQPPRNQLEEKLAQIFGQVLARSRVGINENFFSLGGHSLKAAQVVALIASELQVELPLREFFKHPIVKDLAHIIAQSKPDLQIQIKSQPEQEYYPVSSAQKRLFIITQLNRENIAYNMPIVMEIEGEVDKIKFTAAFQVLIKRHESLRTSFTILNGEPVQKIHNHVDFSVNFNKTKQIKTEDVKAKSLSPKDVQQILDKFVKPFNLTQAPLLRVELIEISKEHYLMLLDMHHIISDGFSMTILLKEFAHIYTGEELSPLCLHYRDYAVWQNDLLSGEKGRVLEEYWRHIFADEVPVLNLPVDFLRPAIQSYEGGNFDFTLEPALVMTLQRMAEENGATLYMILLLLYSILLAKYSTQEDLIIGTPVAGRSHLDFYGIVGMFVNTLALRCAPHGKKTVREFLHELKELVLAAFEHQDYQFELLVEKLALPRDLGRNPLFCTVFALQNITRAARTFEFAELKFSEYIYAFEQAKFDLTLVARETEDGLNCSFNYARKLFKPATIARMAVHYQNLVRTIVKEPELQLAQIDLLSPAERKEILVSFNQTLTQEEHFYPLTKTADELIELQAVKTPEAIAVIFRDFQLTYCELNQRAECLAFDLRAKGLKSDEIVGLLAERSPELIIGILAILKAGGAYAPISPEYPQERSEFILTDSQVRILLIQEHLKAKTNLVLEVIYLEKYGDPNWCEPTENKIDKNSGKLAKIHHSRHLAYVIYTSGSTGIPKGVMVEHKSLVNFIYATYHKFNQSVGIGDRGLLITNIAFDVSIYEIFLPLFFGAAVVIYSGQLVFDVTELANEIINRHITLAYLPPMLLRDFYTQIRVKEGLRLNKILLGVEPIKDDIVFSYLKLDNFMQIINGYGPTESTVCATEYYCTAIKPTGENIPIGKPLSNLWIYILDKYNQLVPIGVPGELCISGAGLARGYLNRPDLTAEKFVENPFKPGERMYHTGDLAKWLPDGNIQFMGRIDQQVKIRGIRIEPREIEVQLLNHGEIKEVIVISRENKHGDKYLATYFTALRDIPISELKEYLLVHLPDYMVPAFILQLPAIPLTSNGKVNHRALPEMAQTINTGRAYIPPSDQIEIKLADIWQNVLGLEQVSINDTFFELGGNSLTLIKVYDQLHSEFSEINLSITDLFSYNTIAELSKVLRPKLSKDGSDDEIEEFHM